MILDDLVLDNAHAGLLDRHFCERNPRLICGNRRGPEDLVHLFLRKFCEFLLCGADAGKQRFQRIHCVNNRIIHHNQHSNPFL